MLLPYYNIGEALKGNDSEWSDPQELYQEHMSDLVIVVILKYGTLVPLELSVVTHF